MKKAINIFTILAVIIAVIDVSVGILPELGLSKTAIAWVRLAGLAAVAISNVLKPKE